MNIEEYRAEQAAAAAAEQERRKQVLVNFMKLLHGHTNTHFEQFHLWKGNLFFNEWGKGKLWSIIGWLTGLAHAGQEELAIELACQFDEQMQYWAGYGGTFEVKAEKGDGMLEIPRFRVVLGSDWTFAGFTIAVYKPVLNEVRIEKASAFERAWDATDPLKPGDDGTRMSNDNYWRRWDECVKRAEQELRLEKALELWKHYRVEYLDGSGRSERDLIHYGFSHNGALIYRGPGGTREPFCVDISQTRDRFWGAHF